MTLTPTTSPTGGGPAQSHPNSAYADELVAIAEEAPRLLVTADGWSISRANDFQGDHGELEFTNGGQAVGLFCGPGEVYADLLADRAHENEALGEVRVAGHQAPVFHYPGTDRYTALWTDGDHFVEFDGSQSSEADFRALAQTLEAVDVETWLDAMPDSVITPAEQPAAVADVTTGIVVPPGFDETLWVSQGVTDRYQLGAQVTGAAACAWLDIWLAGEASGDQGAMTQAAEAMATSKTWPILLEMDGDGDYPEVIWLFADAMNTGGIDALGSDIRDPEYKGLLGCSA